MEQCERDKIHRLIPELIEFTECNYKLIVLLYRKNILSRLEVDELTNIKLRQERNDRFYFLIQGRVGAYQHLVEGLRITKQSKVLQLLGEPYTFDNETVCESICSDTDLPIKKSRLHQKPLLFHVDWPCELFSGRENELEQLEMSLLNDGSTTIISSKCSILGLGGIGKTQLARKLIEKISCGSFPILFENVVWINAATELSAAKDFKTLATDKLGIKIVNESKEEKDIACILDDVYTRLTCGKSLVVFDNVKSAELLQTYFPKADYHSSSNIHVLITSQDSDWDFGTQIFLSGLKLEDAIQFVKKGLSSQFAQNEDFENDVTELVTRLQNFPLAITQAISFIKEKRKISRMYGIKEYLVNLEENAKVVLSKSFKQNLTGYGKTTYDTIVLSLKQLDEYNEVGQIARRLLGVMAYLSPENIEDTLFKGIDINRFAFEEALHLLNRFSIVTFSPEDNEMPLQIHIHRVVQMVLRCVLESEEQTEAILKEAIKFLEVNIKYSSVQHGMSVWKHAANMGNLISSHSFFPEQIFWILRNDFSSKHANQFVNGVLSALSKHFSWKEKPELYVQYETLVGECMSIKENRFERKLYFEKLLRKSLEVLDSCHPQVLRVRRLVQHENEQNYEERLEELRNICESWKRILGEKENFETVILLNLIADTLCNLKLQEESIAARKEFFSKAAKLEIGSVYDFNTVEVKTSAIIMMAYAAKEKGEISKEMEMYQEVLPEFQLQRSKHERHVLPVTQLSYSSCLFYSGDFHTALKTGELVWKKFAAYPNVYLWDPFEAKYFIALYTSEIDSQTAYTLAAKVYQHYKNSDGDKRLQITRALALGGKCLAQMKQHEKALVLINKAMLDEESWNRRLNACERCMFIYYYVESLLETKQTENILEIVNSLKQDTLTLDELFFMRLKILNVCERVKDMFK